MTIALFSVWDHVHPRYFAGLPGKVSCSSTGHPAEFESDFALCVLLAGKELFGLDTLQKSLWIKLLEEMFLGMPSEFPWGDEIMLFLHVFNGALILHPEDSALLRQYAATVINTAVHFNHLFSLSGYQWILPTMLQVIRLSERTKLRT